MRLHHCDGKTSGLASRKREAAARDIEINGGVLTWDTGLEREEATPHVYQGTLYSYDLASHTREFWRLPIAPAIYPEFPDERGTYGYSAHTLNIVFWLANAQMTEGRAPEVDRWQIYGAMRQG